MAFKIVLQIVDGQDVLMQAVRSLEPKLKRRFSKEEMDLALLAAEDQLSDSLKQGAKKSKAGVGGTI